MNKKEYLAIIEIYKQQYRTYIITEYDHTLDALKGMRQILKAININYIKLENEVNSADMGIIVKEAYETIERIFFKHKKEYFKWELEEVKCLFDEYKYYLTEEDQHYVKKNMELIPCYA